MWNQKSKSCIKHLFTVNKLLRLWYFVSVLNLKFLDQLERRHCKETPFFRPFYIGAPKGPFLWGLTSCFWLSLEVRMFRLFQKCMIYFLLAKYIRNGSMGHFKIVRPPAGLFYRKRPPQHTRHIEGGSRGERDIVPSTQDVRPRTCSLRQVRVSG